MSRLQSSPGLISNTTRPSLIFTMSPSLARLRRSCLFIVFLHFINQLAPRLDRRGLAVGSVVAAGVSRDDREQFASPLDLRLGHARRIKAKHFEQAAVMVL